MNFRKMLAVMAVCAVIISAGFILPSCRSNGAEQESDTDAPGIEPMNFADTDLSEYIILGEYKGLTVISDGDAAERSDALWQRVVSGVTVKKYPEQQVDYYFSQSVKKYQYYARISDNTYEYVLEHYGMTEEKMLEEARKMVLEDMVFYAIARAENIELTDSEKTANFDRYVEKYVESYGYPETYVRSYMSEYIYETMLFDKTMEALLSWNTVTGTG